MITPSKMYIEVTPHTYHSSDYVRQYDVDSLAKAKGFRSMYLYNQETYDYIKKNGAVRNLNKFPVYSDTLFVDFDDGDDSIEGFKKILSTSKIKWDMYFSGSKGYHFHIPVEPMYGKHVPFSQKQFILGLGITTADVSIYKHTGLFRLPGTWHMTTGNPKELVESSEGNVLNVPYLEPDNEISVVPTSCAEFVAGLNRTYDYTISEPGPGHRHTSLLSVAKHLTAAGAEDTTIYDLCRLVHESWEYQYDNPEEKIQEIVQRARKWQNHTCD